MSLEKLNKVEELERADNFKTQIIGLRDSQLQHQRPTKPGKDAGPNPTKAERERRVDVMQEQLTQLTQFVVSIAKHQAISPPSSSPTASQTKAGIPKDKHHVTCIYCYMRDLPCDNDSPCRECWKTHRQCKRAMCKDFTAGVCKRPKCTRAHEGDEKIYPNIVHAGHVMKAKKKRREGRKGGRARKEKVRA